MNAAVDHYLSVRHELTLPGQGLPWLDSLRAQGSRRFEAVGFPTQQDENWRYTNVRSIQRQAFARSTGGWSEPQKERLASCALPGVGSSRYVFVDGHYAESLSSPGGHPEGVTVTSLSAALGSGMEGIEASLGTCVPEEANGFSALNTAFIEDGIYLHVRDGCEVERPIELVFFNTDQGGQLVQPRNLYVVGRNGKVNIIERYVSFGERSHLTNAISELIADRSSVVEHTRLQEEGGKVFHVGGVFMHLFDGSTVVSNNVALGSLIARTELLVNLKGKGASCDLNGVYLANGRQHVDNFTQVDHEQPDCKSNEFYKGVLDNRARAVFRGRVVVHKDAQKTDAQQQNRNLLLSQDAEIDTKPQLEIYADDVICSHGATVGQLDDDALFYLRSRAIDDVTARSLLTYAFAADIIGRFSLQPVRDHVESELSRKLFGVNQLEELA